MDQMALTPAAMPAPAMGAMGAMPPPPATSTGQMQASMMAAGGDYGDDFRGAAQYLRVDGSRTQLLDELERRFPISSSPDGTPLLTNSRGGDEGVQLDSLLGSAGVSALAAQMHEFPCYESRDSYAYQTWEKAAENPVSANAPLNPAAQTWGPGAQSHGESSLVETASVMTISYP